MPISNSRPVFTRKIVLIIACGIGIPCIGVPIYSFSKPFLFTEARAKNGSYSDVVDMKEISLMAIQRLQYSKVMTYSDPKDENDLDKCSLYIRRIMRGHVTTYLDFSDINTNTVENSHGEKHFSMPCLTLQPVIDEWIYYDSKGTGKKEYGTGEITRGMNREFRDAMLDEATKNTNRIARAKKQAEQIVKLLYPDEDISSVSFDWPDDPIRIGLEGTK